MMLWIMLLLRLRAVCFGGTYDLDWVFIIPVIGALVLPIVSTLYLAREARLPGGVAPWLMATGVVGGITWLIADGVVGGITSMTEALTAGVELACR